MFRRYRVESRIVRTDARPISFTEIAPKPLSKLNVKDTTQLGKDAAMIVSAMYVGKKLIDTSTQIAVIVIKTKLK